MGTEATSTPACDPRTIAEDQLCLLIASQTCSGLAIRQYRSVGVAPPQHCSEGPQDREPETIARIGILVHSELLWDPSMSSMPGFSTLKQEPVSRAYLLTGSFKISMEAAEMG